MTNKQAKEILENYNRWRKGVGTESLKKLADFEEALSIAIQCLEDSIEGFQLMEAIDEVNKKLEIKRTCKHTGCDNKATCNGFCGVHCECLA
jgi:hypothetical protein